MASLTTTAQQIQPASKHTYLDRLHLAIQSPLNDTQLERLSKWIVKVDNRRLPHHRALRQRLHLVRPPLHVLRMPQLFHGRLMYGEIGLDWMFACHADCQLADAFVGAHHVKRYHRDQGVRYVDGITRYTGPRSAPTNFVGYADKHDRYDGEINCAHADWRMRGRASLCRCGATSIAAMLALDLRKFWRERLLLFAVDFTALGRMINNNRNGTRRRHWDRFAHIGETAFMVAGSVQNLIDKYRHEIRVHQCLIPLNVDHLLPEGSLYSDRYTCNLTLTADNPTDCTEETPDFSRPSYHQQTSPPEACRTPLHHLSALHTPNRRRMA